MRYYGFAARDHLVLQNITLDKDKSFLEIGVGAGSVVELIAGKVKEIYGVDISAELIALLDSIHKGNGCVKMRCLDACGNASLGKKFDVIYSADTVEHVEKAEGFFNFIARHLSANGTAIVTFPNESEEKHHGVTWFGRKKNILELIDGAGMGIIDFYEVRPTVWHGTIRRWLWDFPRSLIFRGDKKYRPQSFEQTAAFQIFKNEKSLKAKILACYAKTITEIAALLPLYDYFEVGEEIGDKTLFLRLKRKSC
jgi:SAM-dependent methyltransferase